MNTTTASTATNTNTNTIADTARRGVTRSLALAGCGLVAAGAFTVVGGSGPVAAGAFDPSDIVVPAGPLVVGAGALGNVELPSPVGSGDFSPVLYLPLPGDDGPPSEIPFPGERGPLPEITIPEGPLTRIPERIPPEVFIPEGVPECVELDTDWLSALHTDNGDLTVTSALAYTGPANPCDTLIVVHSLQLNAALEFLGDLDTQLVPLVDLAAAPGGMMDVTVPIDWCFARVLTNVEGFPLDDDTYIVDTPPVGDFPGCDTPPDTTMPTDTPDDTPTDTMPPSDTPDDTRPPSNTVPGGELPETGAESMVLAVIGGAFVILGGTLAGLVRGLQRRQ